MKFLFFITLSIFLCLSCGKKKELNGRVYNPVSGKREEVIIKVALVEKRTENSTNVKVQWTEVDPNGFFNFQYNSRLKNKTLRFEQLTDTNDYILVYDSLTLLNSKFEGYILPRRKILLELKPPSNTQNSNLEVFIEFENEYKGVYDSKVFYKSQNTSQFDTDYKLVNTIDGLNKANYKLYADGALHSQGTVLFVVDEKSPVKEILVINL